MVIRTLPYALQEIMQILHIRATVENIQIEDDALALVASIGTKTSLRYAVQLLTPSKILAKTYGTANITKAQVEETSKLFLDAKASAKLLKDNASKYLV